MESELTWIVSDNVRELLNHLTPIKTSSVLSVSSVNTEDVLIASNSKTSFTRSKNYLDCDVDCDVDRDLDHDPEDVPVYMGHSLFNSTKGIILLFIVQSFLHRNPPNIWIKIIQIAIRINSLHGTKFLDPDCDLD